MSSVAVARQGTVARGAPPRARGRALRLVLAGLGALCLAALVLRVAGGPLFAVRRVVVFGEAPLPEPEALAIAGVQVGESLLGVDAAAVRARLEAVPLVRRAEVQFLLSGTVRITLERREAVALIVAESGGRSVPALIDADGVVFATAGSGGLDLPVLSGVAGGSGDRIPRRFLGILEDLAALQRRAPALLRAVSEVRVEAPGGDVTAPGPVEFLMYLTASPVPLRARGTIDERLVQYGLLAVDLLSKQGSLGDIRELDVRGGEVVYRLKED